MKKLTIKIFILTIFLNSTSVWADGFWPLVKYENESKSGRIIKLPRKKETIEEKGKKIYRIGSDDVYYQSLHSNKIERIGNKRVEYRMLNNQILKIGDEFVTYSMGGKMLKVGEKEVIYKDNLLYKIGNDEVFYK